MKELFEKAKQMAKLDFESNGFYANAPYKVSGPDGEIYKAKIVHANDTVYINLVRPERTMYHEEMD